MRILILLILKLKNVLGKFGQNYKMADFTCKFPFRIFKRCLFQVRALFMLILCIKKVFGKFGKKLQNDQLDLKISVLLLVSQIMFYFVYFEYKKDFSHILVKSYTGCLFYLTGLINAIPVSGSNTWMLKILLLQWLGDLSKRKPEFQVSHDLPEIALKKSWSRKPVLTSFDRNLIATRIRKVNW